MRTMLLIYRIIYGALLMVLLVGMLRNVPFAPARISEMILFWLFVCALIFGILAAFAFQRVTRLMTWLGIILLCALLTWRFPFWLHETHTFDPGEAASEIHSHNVRAGISYAILLMWLLSLPIIRSIYERRSTTTV